MAKFGINVSVWTGSFDESSLPLVRKAKQLGFDGIEVLIHEPGSINLGKTRDALRENDVEFVGVAALNSNTDIASDDEATRYRGIDYLKRCVEVVAKLGGDSVNGMIYTAWGKITGRARTREEWQHSVEALREVCRYARDYDVTLSVEPHNRFRTYFLNTAADAVEFVRDIGEPNAGVQLDTFHMNIEEKSFYKAITEVGSLLHHFHCCENDRGVPGTGHVDWDGVFKALSEIGYGRWLVIEAFVSGVNYPSDMASSASVWRKIAPSGDSVASEGLKFLKDMAKKYLQK